VNETARDQDRSRRHRDEARVSRLRRFGEDTKALAIWASALTRSVFADARKRGRGVR
jgi:hypothetical protein